MSQDHEEQQSNHASRQLMTRGMVLRAILKGVFLYLIFSACYTLIAPMERGLVPSFHNNGVIAGRVRLAQDYVLNTYLLINDHIISTATADTYNIVILGSSEMWGARSLADETTPAFLDAMHMVAADGRPVRVYNLSYPVSYGLKDLIILDVLLERHIPIDLIIESVFDETLSYYNYPHKLVHGNLPLEMAVIKKYSLFSAYPYVLSDIGHSVPFVLRLSDDALTWREWLAAQVRGIKWTLTGDEFVGVPPNHLQRGKTYTQFERILTLNRMSVPLVSDFIRVFQQAHQDSGIPLLILDAPIPYIANEFSPWLRDQTTAFGLPLLDCWNALREPAAFEDRVHLKTAANPLYARILAKYLTDPALASVGVGLPLKLPANSVVPSETCAFYAAEGEP